jgi:hypothetical protein
MTDNKVDEIRSAATQLFTRLMHSVTSSAIAEIWPIAEWVASDLGRDRQTILADVPAFGVERGELTVKGMELTSLAIDVLRAAIRVPWVYNGRELKIAKKADVIVELLLHGMAK